MTTPSNYALQQTVTGVTRLAGLEVRGRSVPNGVAQGARRLARGTRAFDGP